MTLESPPSTPGSRRNAGFQSTLWSRVRAAGRGDPAAAAPAMEALCRDYWRPIYAFLRFSGQERQNAKDLTQDFFAYVLEEGLFSKADSDRGRFRSFLIGTLKFYVSNQQARNRARKRGGDVKFVPLHLETEDGPLRNEPATQLTPERIYDRKWALAVIERAMTQLTTEYHRAGMTEQFALLRPYLTGDTDDRLPILAAHLGKSDGAARVLVCRLRNRFRRLVRDVIADTVSSPGQIEAELRDLEAALRDG